MKKLVLLCGALALLALEVRAQTPEYTAKMTRMLELSGSDAVMKELPKQMIGMMKQQVPAIVLPGGRSKWGGRLRFGKRRHLDELHRVPTRNLSMKKGRWSMEMRDTYISFAVRIG